MSGRAPSTPVLPQTASEPSPPPQAPARNGLTSSQLTLTRTAGTTTQSTCQADELDPARRHARFVVAAPKSPARGLVSRLIRHHLPCLQRLRPPQLQQMPSMPTRYFDGCPSGTTIRGNERGECIDVSVNEHWWPRSTHCPLLWSQPPLHSHLPAHAVYH
jgi:hypothetical protein